MTDNALATAPRGFSVDHPKIGLLRLKHLAISAHHDPAAWMHGPEFVEHLRAGWRTVSVWNDWITENLPTAVEVAR